MDYILNLLQSGFASLAAYLAAHVLLCLLPAFFIAGSLSSMLPKEAITKYLGKDTPKWISYPASALGGFVLAVCSCTIMPLFASIYKKGAGLGPAITFLFVGPAVNILAITLTGVQIGADIAIARIVLSIFFGISIGLIMQFIFRKDEEAREVPESKAFSNGAVIPSNIVIFFILLLSILLVGTLPISLLTDNWLGWQIDAQWTFDFQIFLDGIIPPNPALGIEGVSVQGVVLISLLFLIGFSAWFGLNKVDEKITLMTYVSLILISTTIIIASFKVTTSEQGLLIGLPGKLFGELLLVLAIWWMAIEKFETYEIQDWLWETWRFVKQIIPLLIVGVFLAGVARVLIPATWIESLAGQNTILANFVGVVFGVFMYFPTLVEVPIAQTFLSLGMHRGPLLAYLLADPELSVQSILITNSVIGRKKTAVYVILVAIFSTLAGLIFGLFIN